MIQQSATQMLFESTNNNMQSRNNPQHGTMSQASPPSTYSKLQTSPPPIPFMNKNNEIYRSDNSPVQKDSTDLFKPIGGSYVSNNVSSSFQSKEKQSMLPNLRDLLNEAPPSTHVVTESLRMGQQQQQYNQVPPTPQQQNSFNYSSSNQNRTLHSYYSNQSNTTMPSNQYHVAHPNLGYEKIPAHTQPTSATLLYKTNNSHSRLSPTTQQQPPPQQPQHAFDHQPTIHAPPPHQQQQFSSRMSPQDNTASSHPHQHTQHAFQSMSISPNSALHSNQGNMLNRTIQDLERELEYQSRFIADLERENGELRRELMYVRQQQQQNGHSNVISNGLLAASRIPIRTKRDDHLTFESKKRSISEVQPTALTTYLTSSVNDSKKRKTSSPSASNQQTDSNTNNNNREISIVDESVDKLNTANMHKYIVKWKGETYVLVSIFKNRTQILNYYVPLYQSQNPDKVCKIVLSNEDYKQLSNENPETVEKKKHAWRVSVFSLDFYNFVKNFQKKNHQQKASSFISFDGSTVQK